jgi:uncharacterized protein (DUF1778 family)
MEGMKSEFTKIRVRTTPDARSVIKRAAEQRGMSMSKFVVQASVEHAIRTLGAHENRPTLEEMNAKFFAALDEIDRQRKQDNLGVDRELSD